MKLRGYRIELGEIESEMRAHAGVREAAVLARDESTEGGKRLVGYYVAEPGENPDAESLRKHLKERLPEYMLPAALVRLEALPLTANGKLDRKALPAPKDEAYVRAEYEAPRGEVEMALAQIWQQLLDVERVGRRDNFFELGGHSLHSIKLVSRVSERLDARLSVAAIFQRPTVADLADMLSASRGASQADEMEFDEGAL